MSFTEMVITNIELVPESVEPPRRAVVIDGNGKPFQRLGGAWFSPGSSAFKWPWLAFPVVLVAYPASETYLP